MFIVYPLQAQYDYTELLFSLRSVEKYFTPPYEVVVVGDKIPEWLTNVTQICVPDILGRKQLTIKKKIYAALEVYPTDHFFMNDDVYLLEETDGKYPYFYQGMLTTVGESGARPLLNELTKMGKPIKNFDLHQPLIYDYRFKDVFANFPSEVIVKSCYCNFLGIDGEYYPDLKINRKIERADIEAAIKGRKYFSSGPSGLGYVIPVLQTLFPKKSNFEL